jgi:hypothetical protein
MTLSNLLQAIKSRDWVAANETFGAIMQEKVADRIQQERQSIGQTLVKEAALDEALKKCQKCGKEFSDWGLGGKTCSSCLRKAKGK